MRSNSSRDSKFFRAALRLTVVYILWATIGAQVAQSRDREVFCKGTLGNISVGRIRVPSGYQCHLRGTRVRGPVIVEDNAILKTTGAQIDGSILSLTDDHWQLDLDSATQFLRIMPFLKYP